MGLSGRIVVIFLGPFGIWGVEDRAFLPAEGAEEPMPKDGLGHLLVETRDNLPADINDIVDRESQDHQAGNDDHQAGPRKEQERNPDQDEKDAQTYSQHKPKGKGSDDLFRFLEHRYLVSSISDSAGLEPVRVPPRRASLP